MKPTCCKREAGELRMGDESDKPTSSAESSFVLAERDYADIAHLENPSVIERILSRSRSEATSYIGGLLQSGVPRYVLAGPKVAWTAMAIEALTDFGREVSEWRKAGRIPEDFSGRAPGYQSWVELLVEIDSNPVDTDRLKAMKAMFLAANQINATDGQSILAYQLFGIAKKLSSGDLLVLNETRQVHGGPDTARNWLAKVSNTLGHGLTALVELHERVLIDNGLIHPRIDQNMRVNLENGRLTDLGLAFCRNIDQYQRESGPSEGRPSY